MASYLIKDIGKVITGNTPSKNQVEFYDSDDIRFVKPDIISDSQITKIESTNEYISEQARSKARIVGAGAVFVTCIGSIGKIGIAVDGEYAFNQQINAIEPNENILPQYMAYCLLYNKNRLADIANAPVVPIINKRQFENFTVNITEDLSEQKRIIEVLNKVSNIILLRNQQLKELDNLIQARFVEMFGNPIDNTKNLPTVLLGDACYLKAGMTTAADAIHDKSEEYQIPCYGGNGIRGYVKEATQSGIYPIIGRQGALCGNVHMATGEFHATEHAVLVTPLIESNMVWIYYLLKFMDLYRYHTGAAQPGLAVKTLNTVEIPLAELSMQEQFAAFVSHINKSKVVLQQALNETQLLFDNLMQKYYK